MTFVAPMPEQVGTLTMHFPEVLGGPYQKFSSPKLGELGQIDNLFMYRQFAGKSSAANRLRKCFVVVAICSGMGAMNFIFRAPTDFSQ